MPKINLALKTSSAPGKAKIIFFGNGPLADAAKSVFLRNENFEIIFHARTKEDLDEVKRLKTENQAAYGVLASYGVLIKQDLLDLFEPEGIFNIHPSLLPDLRGPSPIETAILRGDTKFSVSIMKLVKACDAGPIYYQTTLSASEILSHDSGPASTMTSGEALEATSLSKAAIYLALAKTGALWLAEHLKTHSNDLPIPKPQNDQNATFSQKLDKSLSPLDPKKPASVLLNEIRAYLGFPKSKYTFYDIECIVLEAHVSDIETPVAIKCADGKYLAIDRLQPASRKPMDAKSFLNGLRH